MLDAVSTSSSTRSITTLAYELISRNRQRNLVPFEKTLTYLDLIMSRLIVPEHYSINDLRLEHFTALQNLQLILCTIEIPGPLPESLVDLHLCCCYDDGAASDSWTSSNLPKLKNVSLSSFKDDRSTRWPVDAEMLLDVLATSASRTRSNTTGLGVHDGEQLQQGFQLETLTINDGPINDGPPCSELSAESIFAAGHLHSILQNNCMNLTSLDLSLPLLMAHHLDDVANFCPSLKDLTIGRSCSILPITVELFAQKMSGRLQRLCLHQMPCYEKNTYFDSTRDARSSLVKTCPSLDIELNWSWERSRRRKKFL